MLTLSELEHIVQILRPAQERGHADRGWLTAWHSFSFGDYDDPERRGYGSLLVINEDRIVPTAGFPPHRHRDMEIITYVLSGSLRHRDSTGGGADLRHGELQVMHAGRGIVHSEVNPSPREPVHLLQIWIVPDRAGHAPGYEQQALDTAALRSGFARVVGPAGSGAPFHIHQDAALDIAWLAPGELRTRALVPGRQYYLHLARGTVQANGQPMQAGDALTLQDEPALEVQASAAAELLLFELAAG